MERAAEVFAAIHCLVIGLSHVAQPMAWVEFFVWLREKGRAGVFVNGFLSLGFGSVIVAFHNVWAGLPAVLTVLGWAQVFKGMLSFIAPQIAMRSLKRVSSERSIEFVWAGVVLLALSSLFWYLAFTNQ
jgi:hypothetical protein